VERGRELAAVDHALGEAGHARGQLVLVEGPAGIGKTSVLRAAADRATESGFVGLKARAGELERDFAYGCVRQLLESMLAHSSDAERERLFDGAAALARPLFSTTGTAEPPPDADTDFAALHGLYWLVSNLTDQAPVVLVVDDLQWADAATLRFLNYLAPRLDGLRLAVVASTRTGERVPPDLARLAAGPEAIVLRPEPLTMQGTRDVCAARLGEAVTPEFAAACRAATGGNPYFLEELLREPDTRTLAADPQAAARIRRIGPTTVGQAVLMRLLDAPAATAALVRAAAVLGDNATLAEAAELAGVTEAEAASAADLLVALEILAPGDLLEFAHPIVREAVYADIGHRQRAAVHARAATVLAAHSAPEERVAAQIAAADPAGDPQRVALLRRVAADGLARGAPTAAVAWLSRAVAEPPPEEMLAAVLLELGFAELRVAAPSAVDHLGDAVELLAEPAPLARAARLLGNAYTWRRQSDRSIEVLDAAIPRVEPADRELALVLEADLAAHAQVASWTARAPAAERLERYAGLQGETPGERLVLASLAFVRARASESADEAAAHLTAALAGGQLLDEQDLDVTPSLYVLLVGLLATEAVDVTDSVLRRMLTDARARVSIPGVAFVLAHQAVAAMHRGDVERATADAGESLALLSAHSIPLGSALALSALVEALVEDAAVDRAQQALSDHGFDGDVAPGMPSNALLFARGRLRLAEGRSDEAYDDLVEFGRRDELWGGASPLASRWRSLASTAMAAMGEQARACELARDDLERAQRWGAPSGIGVALRAHALAEGGPAMIDRLRDAADRLAASPARLEQARALTELGAALRRDNQRREARVVLRDALDLAQRCHARAVADVARTELNAAGGRSSAAAMAGPQELTVSERRVAELAAEGHSNPEIAQTLFVTRKTVETHLGSVYRKLAITGRGKLARALAGTAKFREPVGEVPDAAPTASPLPSPGWTNDGPPTNHEP
jgi:DNA-binding CsgD family transcriptional regulator